MLYLSKIMFQEVAGDWEKLSVCQKVVTDTFDQEKLCYLQAKFCAGLLYPVESSSSETTDCNSSPTPSPVGRASIQHSRPKRKAAEKAKLKIKESV